MIVAVIPADALAGVVGAVILALVWITRLCWRLSERVARLEERVHHLEEAKLR